MLSQALTSIPLIDHHCHAFYRFSGPVPLERFRKAFTETDHPEVIQRDMPYSLAYRWTLKQMAQRLGCESTEVAVHAARNAANLQAYTQSLMQEVNMRALYIDTGHLPDEVYSPAEFAELTGLQVRPVLRLENAAEQLILGGASFSDLLDTLRERVVNLRADGHVGVKSIAAYRTGLEITQWSRAQAEEAFRGVSEEARTQGRIRLNAKPVIDYLLWDLFPILDREEIPIQFHVGYGDPSTDLRFGNPLHLREILEVGGFRRMPITLLHCYPYIREAGYLASVYPNVYLDVSLAIPLAVSGSRRYVAQALELAPATKVLFATDAHTIPELYWAGAVAWRNAMAEVLEGYRRDGLLTLAETTEWAELIFYRNALRIYQGEL
jgi:predicted TIM-barrel fold metal-dependent hydrolase